MNANDACVRPPRSAGTRQTLRPPQPWPPDQEFKILSIDGGGVRGLLPAMIIAELEQQYLAGESIGQHFDMITGTSTGGIIALALAQRIAGQDIADLYLEKGRKIFPGACAVSRFCRRAAQFALYAYDREALVTELRNVFGESLLASSRNRLCIPAFEGQHGEPHIYKTPHHPDYQLDGKNEIVEVALATAAAPTYFKAIDQLGYRLLDGGVYANNPVMVGLVDALTCFDIRRRQVKILSLGCRGKNVRVGRTLGWGGRVHWAWKFPEIAMQAQSHSSLGQAYLLVGKDHVVRLDAKGKVPHIGLDDVDLACEVLPGVAENLVKQEGEHICRMFLRSHHRASC